LGFFENPSEKVKDDKHCMKNDKNPIAKMEPEIFQDFYFFEFLNSYNLKFIFLKFAIHKFSRFNDQNY
tara:strand:+ start:338 stop:541 length:204 start_codon:yes stop_codon:yes gene_type:complete